jgi:hypothetical protein
LPLQLRGILFIMNYSQELKNPIWQKKRLNILERDNWTCKGCQNTENTLHVHHITYEKGKKPWDYEDGNFITLCEECHNRVHEVIKFNAAEFFHAGFYNSFSIKLYLSKNETYSDGCKGFLFSKTQYDFLTELDNVVFNYNSLGFNEKMAFVVKYLIEFIET